MLPKSLQRKVSIPLHCTEHPQLPPGSYSKGWGKSSSYSKVASGWLEMAGTTHSSGTMSQRVLSGWRPHVLIDIASQRGLFYNSKAPTRSFSLLWRARDRAHPQWGGPRFPLPGITDLHSGLPVRSSPSERAKSRNHMR